MALKDFSAQDHAAITTLGSEFATAEVVGCALGWWLDQKWGTSPWGIILGAVAGFALGMYIILRAVRELDRQNKNDKQVQK